MKFIKESSPHIRRKDSAWRMMLDVIIALLPTFIFSAVIFPLNTLVNFLVSGIIMCLAEFAFIGLTHMMPKDEEKHTFKEKFDYAYKGRYQLVNFMSPLVSALIYTLITPSGAPIYSVIVGALIGIILGKLVFGGLGNNIFNPAAVGMVAAKLSFGTNYGKYLALPEWFTGVPSTEIGGTLLGNIGTNGYESINNVNFLDMFLGKMPGTLGEVYTITILIGLIYLIIRRTIDFRILFSYFGTFIVMMIFAGICIHSILPSVGVFKFTLFELLSGGVIFGGVFMFTDPVTSPITKPSRIMFGMIGAVLTVLIRLFGALPEGVAISLLIANMFAPVLDFPKWSSTKYTYKNVLAMALIFVVPTIIMIISLLFGGVVK